MDIDFPTGIVTFLFTDLEDSTRLWETYPDAMQNALARHDLLLKDAVEVHEGAVVKTTGDGIHAVFASAVDAVAAAVAAQTALAEEVWGDLNKLHVRMAVHTGEAQFRDGDYYGTMPKRAARLMEIAHGGQILLSQAVEVLLRDHLPAGMSLVDLGEHGLRDLIRPEHVYQLIDIQLSKSFPPLRSLSSFPNNLPVQLNRFVGRARESFEVKQMLIETRLLTMTGVGGTGKTRLMLQVAADVLPQFSNGVWLVELAAVTDPELVLEQVARTLGVQEQPDRSLLESLKNYLRLKQLLLLLDNCEHLLGASAEVSQQLLQTCPQLKVIATSREGLAIPGEITFQVPSLSLPDPEGEISPEEILRAEATQLFLERAQASLSSFHLSEENAPAIAQICHRLDGIPLAIELAAARVKALGVQDIASRLDDRFRLLTGGSRTALPRQQTLQALIDWSWNLLTDSEQQLLQRLSVFAGGWTLEAAESIVNDQAQEKPGFVEVDVLDGLTQLVEKSLVVVDHSLGEEVRYRLLETIRQFAQAKLLDAGEIEALRDRHTRFFIELIIQSEPHLEGPEFIVWLNRLKKDFANIQAAMAWSLARHPALALHLAGSLVMALMARGMFGLSMEFRPWLEEVLVKKQDLAVREDERRASSAARVRALTNLVGVLLVQGNTQKGQVVVEEAVAFARKEELDDELPYTLAMRALVNALGGALEIALASAEEALQRSRQGEPDFSVGFVFVTVGPAIGFVGDERTLAITQEVDRIAHRTGNPLLLAHSAIGRAYYTQEQGKLDEAIAHFWEANARFKEFEGRHFINMSRSEIAHIHRQRGDLEEAVAIYRESIVAWQELGHPPAVAHQLECFAQIAEVLEDKQRSAVLLGAATALRKAVRAEKRFPHEQAEYDDMVEQLTSQMGDSEFRDAFARGQRMSLEQAIAFALNQ